MAFMERLQSAFILKTPMYHPNEAHIIEHKHELFFETIIHGHVTQMIQMIIEGFDIDFHELAATPPLSFAVKHNQKECVEALLNYGANINIKDKDQKTPLHYALTFEQHELLVILLKNGANFLQVDAEGIAPFALASEREQEIMLETRCDVNTTAYNIFELVQQGKLQRLTFSYQHLSDLERLNASGQSLLHLSVLSNNIKMVIYLLNKSLNIDAVDLSENTPLLIALSHEKYLNIALLLLDRGATIEHKNSDDNSALSVAIRNGNPSGAQLLIKRGANININDGAHTPLTLTHLAILSYPQLAQEYRDLETFLLNKGATVDVSVNSLLWTPLASMVTKQEDKKNLQHTHLLLQLGANVNHLDINGRTPLMLACSMGRLESIKMLLNNYADINKVDNFGWSALMFGVYYNHYDTVSFLLENDVDPNFTSTQGLSALKIAQEHKRTKMERLLYSFGAIATSKDDED